jgi:hypothetical protein
MADNDLLDLMAFTCDSLNQQKCVLVLGPDIYIKEIDNQVWDRNGYFLQLGNETPDSTFFPNDGVLKFSDTSRFKIQQKIKSFYTNGGDIQLLESIANIRFPLIINASPDESLFQYLKQLDPNTQFQYFEGDQDENKAISFDKNNPLIYNIFGWAMDPQSLIISHDILYRKIQELLSVNSFPGSIRDYLQKANSFLFLGFKFDSWAFQLLSYKIINQKVIDKEKIRLSSSRNEKDNMTNIIMAGALGMSFTDTPPLQILNILLKKIKEENYKNLLRDVGKQDKFSSFISYSRKSDGFISKLVERFAVKVKEMNQAENAQTELKLLYDKEDFYYGQSIDSFMTRIGRGKTVLIVVSEHYLKSEYCMIEALRTDVYHKDDQRVFIALVTNDLQLDLKKIEESIQVYQKYWEAQLADLTAEGKKADKNKVINYLEIRDFIPGFIRKIADNNNYVVNLEDIQEPALDNFILQLIHKMREE